MKRSNGEKSPPGKASEDHFHLSKDFVVFDVETTGLNEEKDRVIQLAMLKVKSDGTEEIFDRYFNPCMKREDQLAAFKIHKISPDVLLKEKIFKEYAEQIYAFLESASFLVGHNVRFDWNFLLKEFTRLDKQNGQATDSQNWVQKLYSLNLTLVDTCKLSILVFPNLTKHSLGATAKHLGIETAKQPVVSYSVSSPKKKKENVVKIQTKQQQENGLHDAMMDVLVTKEVFLECIQNEIFHQQRNQMEQMLTTDTHFTHCVESLRLIDQQLKLPKHQQQLNDIKNIADVTMSTLRGSRGKQLKDISSETLAEEIEYLDKEPDINNRRDKILRESVLLRRAQFQD